MKSSAFIVLVLVLSFMAVTGLVVYRMWLAGEISTFAAQSRRERIRLRWVVVGAVNFIAFVAHIEWDRGACVLGYGGHLVGGQYLVPSHGKDIALSTARYFFNLWHGVFFVVLHLLCMLVIWRLH